MVLIVENWLYAKRSTRPNERETSPEFAREIDFAATDSMSCTCRWRLMLVDNNLKISATKPAGMVDGVVANRLPDFLPRAHFAAAYTLEIKKES